MQALAQTLPNANYRTLAGQTQMVKPESLIPVWRSSSLAKRSFRLSISAASQPEKSMKKMCFMP